MNLDAPRTRVERIGHWLKWRMGWSRVTGWWSCWRDGHRWTQGACRRCGKVQTVDECIADGGNHCGCPQCEDEMADVQREMYASYLTEGRGVLAVDRANREAGGDPYKAYQILKGRA